jgi:GT2 family glycosyltransferase
MPELDASIVSEPLAPALDESVPVGARRNERRSRSGRLDSGRLRDPARQAEPVDVSVCIANWNCRDMLRACLESLLDQPQGVRLEVIVIDNDSQDGAPDFVAKEFPEVILHRNPANFGFARANNQAAARAHGQYLFFLNNDTVVPPWTLRRMVEFAHAHPEIGMIGPRLCDQDGRTQVSYRLRPTLATLLHRTSLLRATGLFRKSYRRYRRQDFDPDVTRPVDVLMGAALLLPRDVFFGCGGWDENYMFGGEDLDLSFQVNRQFPVVYHPEVAITHFGRVSTRQHIGFVSTQMAAGFVRYLRKTGHSRLAMWAYKLVVLLDAPVLLVDKGLQYLWRRFHGRHKAAERSLLAFQGAWHFLRHGLIPFLRA